MQKRNQTSIKVDGINSDDSTLDSLYHSDDSNSNNHSDKKPPLHPELVSVLSSSPYTNREKSSLTREKSFLCREKSTPSKDKSVSRRDASPKSEDKLRFNREKSYTEKSPPEREKSSPSREKQSCYVRSKSFVMSSSKSETEHRDRRKSVNSSVSRRSMSKECISRNSINSQDVTFNDSETQKQVTSRLMSQDEIVRKGGSIASLHEAYGRDSKDDSEAKFSKETPELKCRTLIDRNLSEVGESSQTSIKSYLRHLSSSESSVLGQIVRKTSDLFYHFSNYD